jgi:monooxygenase
MTAQHYDVLIIGAGLSGIGAARYLKTRCPGKTFAVLEGKARLGGTWDLFRYPGIRSDSDMHTMGYAFKPWKNTKAIAEGGSILDYIRETADENGLTDRILFEHKVLAADWSSADARWTLTVGRGDGSTATLTCGFLFSCAGYYRHGEGYLPRWDGYGDYEGTLIHPQFWPENLEVAGKTVVIIGSGATAVTLSPSLAALGAKVIQLQRSPTYVVSRPAEDPVANRLKRWLPASLAYHAVRWRNIIRGRIMSKRMGANLPGTKAMLVGMVKAQLGPGYDVAKHFKPDYWPGQQRICMVPDGDMFRAIRKGQVTMVTDEIERFTKTGIQLKDGGHLNADIVVTATGLVLEFLGGVRASVDGQAVDPAKLLIYKGFMYSNVPNLIYFTGYTNASWTLKVDLVAAYACRLLKAMDRKGAKQAVAVAGEAEFAAPAAANKFISGYVKRASHRLPKHGGAFPWIHEQNYFWDRKTLRGGRIEDGTLTLSALRAVVFPASQRADAPEAIAAE